jgi:hypothetical protein
MLIRRSLSQDREPFVVVLLDGEGIIFKDEYLQQGEDGGRNAAKQLEAGLRTYLSNNLPSINEPKLLTKVYINVKSLGELCARSGIISEPAAIHDFVRGFNETTSFSEIVDIGSGKNKAYEKIQGLCHTMRQSTGKPQLTGSFWQKPSKSSFTTAIATRSSWAAPQIVNMDVFLKIP